MTERFSDLNSNSVDEKQANLHHNGKIHQVIHWPVEKKRIKSFIMEKTLIQTLTNWMTGTNLSKWLKDSLIQILTCWTRQEQIFCHNEKIHWYSEWETSESWSWKKLIQRLTQWTREEQILFIKIIWFKNWLAEQQRNESWSWQMSHWLKQRFTDSYTDLLKERKNLLITERLIDSNTDLMNERRANLDHKIKICWFKHWPITQC